MDSGGGALCQDAYSTRLGKSLCSRCCKPKSIGCAFSLTLPSSLLRRSTHVLLVAEHVVACRCEQEPTVLLNRDGSVRATSTGGRNIRSAKTWQNPAHPVIPTSSSSLSMSPTRQRAQPARVTPPSSHSGGPSGLPPVLASIHSSIGTSPGPRYTVESPLR